MKISDDTYRLLAEAATARHEIVSARKDELIPIEAKIEDLEKQIRIAKKAPAQDVKLITDLEASLKEAESVKRDIINKWQDAYDNVNNPYKSAQGQVRAEAQAIDPELTKKAGEIGKEAFNYTKDRLSNNLNGSLSPSFYRDVAAAMSGRQPGNLLNAKARTDKAMAKNAQNDAANRQMEAQKSQQIADRNEYTEAGKVASMQNDAQNRQNIANKEGITGSAAALMRQTNTPDITAERTRQDQQRMVANERRQESDVAQQGATRSMGDAEQAAMQASTYDDIYDAWSRAGDVAGDTKPQDTQQQETDTQKETDNKPYTAEEGKPEADVPDTTEQQASTETQEPEAQEPEGLDTAFFDQLIEAANKMYPDKIGGALGGDRFIERNNYIKNALKNNNFWGAMSSEEQKKWQNYYEPKITSDEDLKNIHRQLSDCRIKWIKHDWDTYGRPSKKDFEWLLNNLQDDQIGIKEGDNFEDDTVLKGYAENIRNYVYNYKPEAMAISPDNDPSVTHIGPMAQDIEKVNPACISKDENGIESVDTGRVAMMNAGAIGDIARSLEDIKTRLARLEAVNGN